MKKLFYGFLVFCALGSFWARPSFAEDQSVDLVSTLNSISEKQDRILTALDEIKGKLQVIQVRTTQ